jgi:hypothetical protein
VVSARRNVARQKPCPLLPKTNFYGWHLSEQRHRLLAEGWREFERWHRLLAEGWREWACGYTSVGRKPEDSPSSSKRV